MSACTITSAQFDHLKSRAETKTNPSGWLTSERKVRAAVWAKTNGLCWYCGNPMNPFTQFAIDHVVPRARGGKDELSNFVPCCRSCNSRKAISGLEEFREKMGAKDRPRFNAEQRSYLESIEVKLPDGARYEFAFEKMGWQP